MAGEQRYQIPVLLDQDGVYIVGVDDLYIHNFVSQGFPKICYVNFIPVLKQFYTQKVMWLHFMTLCIFAGIPSNPVSGTRKMSFEKRTKNGSDSTHFDVWLRSAFNAGDFANWRSRLIC